MNRSLKKIAVDYLGGCCLLCGSTPDLSAYDFHHINPSEKSRQVSEFSSANEEFFAELDKCACLCANCHRTVHNTKNFDHEIFDLLKN